MTYNRNELASRTHLAATGGLLVMNPCAKEACYLPLGPDYVESKLRIGKSALAQKIKVDLQEKSSSVFMWVVLVLIY